MSTSQRRRLTTAALAATLVWCIAAPLPARASGPPPPPDAYRLYSVASVVFVGKVISVGAGTIEVRVLETLKGGPEASDAGTVTVGPIFEEECAVGPDSERTPIYRAGDRVLFAATMKDGVCRVVGPRYGSQDLGDDAAVARAVAVAREFIRIVTLPDVVARRAATVATLLSPDPAFARAALSFRSRELNTPEKSAPHAAGLAAALRAPVPLARLVALRALRGVAAPEAWEGIVALTLDPDFATAMAAGRALAAYPRDAAVTAIERAAAASVGGAGLLVYLGDSPQPLAHQRLLERISRGIAAHRFLVYHALGRRIERVGATPEDIAALIAFLRSDAAASFETHQMVAPLRATGSRVVARALVELVADPRSDAVRRHVAYWMLDEWAPRRPDMLDLVRKNEAAFIAHLDAGEPRSQLVKVLDAVHSAAARAAIERAAKSNPDEHTRKVAREALDAW